MNGDLAPARVGLPEGKASEHRREWTVFGFSGQGGVSPDDPGAADYAALEIDRREGHTLGLREIRLRHRPQGRIYL
jgi:hypothetical protein